MTALMTDYGNPGQLRRPWRTSSASGGNGACVEVASSEQILVRDSEYAVIGRVSPVLAFPPRAWREFLARQRAAG